MVTHDAELDDFGHVKLGGIGDTIADIIQRRTGIETRARTLATCSARGPPSAYDRVLETAGIHAAPPRHQRPVRPDGRGCGFKDRRLSSRRSRRPPCAPSISNSCAKPKSSIERV